MNGMGWGGMWFGWFFGIVILAVVIWAIISLIRNTNNSTNSQNYLSREENALEILKNRYARGEISKEQFEQMKKDMNS